jgi:P-type Cu2+ transporter
MTIAECKLCGLPAAGPAAGTMTEADGHVFCCPGCREVYLNFGADVFAATDPSKNPVRNQESEEPEPQGSEAFLRIDGMHCSSCEILIERLALKIPGILSARTSYATSTARIVYDPNIIDEAQLPNALLATGYSARQGTDDAPEYDYRLDLLRLLVGVALAGFVMMMYVAFFYPVHLGLVSEADLKPILWLAHGVAPWVMFVLTTLLLVYVAAPVFRGAWIGLRALVLNMDNLLAIAILAAWGYSVGQLLSGSLDLYFDVAATIIAVVTIGRYVERNARHAATAELSKILNKWAPRARTRWGGEYRFQTLDELEPGDHVIIWQGEAIPVDGTIVYGRAAVDESLMTGEPFPVTHAPGNQVYGGSLVVDGELEIQVGAHVESRMEDLARIMWNVQSASSGAQTIADRVARVFVPVVLLLAAAVTGLFLISGAGIAAAMLAGLATLIVSCPCTFGLAIPLTTAAGISEALRKGIIVTSADAFERIAGIDIVVLDKTGTLSTGDMAVVDVLGSNDVKGYAAAVEGLSTHPIAKAIASLDDRHTAVDYESHPGKGVVATVNGQKVAVGGRGLFEQLVWPVPTDLAQGIESWIMSSDRGHGVVSLVGWDGKVQGAILTADKARPEWAEVARRLAQHCRLVLLTGAEDPGEYADQSGHVDMVFAGVPPEGKAAVIRQLQRQGTVVMIGDGSNDAPALAAADLGIAFGAPTALAAEAADVIIPGEGLDRIFPALDLIHTIRRRVRQNLGWALVYNAIAIPLALSGLLNPLFAALAMSSSSLLVVWNASRPVPLTPPIQMTSPIQKNGHAVPPDRD